MKRRVGKWRKKETTVNKQIYLSWLCFMSLDYLLFPPRRSSRRKSRG